MAKIVNGSMGSLYPGRVLVYGVLELDGTNNPLTVYGFGFEAVRSEVGRFALFLDSGYTSCECAIASITLQNSGPYHAAQIDYFLALDSGSGKKYISCSVWDTSTNPMTAVDLDGDIFTFMLVMKNTGIDSPAPSLSNL